jgi:hypothetical protein
MEIERQIQSALGNFISETGLHPTAVLIGPGEYLALEDALRTRASILSSQLSAFTGKVTKFMGYDVRLKTQPGIDFEVDVEQSFRLAIKRLDKGL